MIEIIVLCYMAGVFLFALGVLCYMLEMERALKVILILCMTIAIVCFVLSVYIAAKSWLI